VNKTKFGIIGCGAISPAYFDSDKKFQGLELVGCADLDASRAKAKAEQYGCKAMSVDELLADPDIEIVVNLTIPAAHAEIAIKAVEAGKSVHNEKPLVITRTEGRQLLQLAAKKNVRVGCAPDTFMGGGIQTCRKLIEDGAIGKPIAATAFMTCHGHESWHPDPEFYYKLGGGPMFDMGPYYLTAMVALMGPARRVTGSTQTTFDERTITSEPKNGTKIKVDVATHVAGLVDFANGAVATIITSFDVWAANLPCIEIYGTAGSLSVPDPNTFAGPVRLFTPAGNEWQDIELTHGYTERGRGIGVADMACGLRSGRPHRASGELAYHVLDIMHAFHDSSDTGRHVELESTCAQPAMLPVGLEDGKLDD